MQVCSCCLLSRCCWLQDGPCTSRVPHKQMVMTSLATWIPAQTMCWRWDQLTQAARPKQVSAREQLLITVSALTLKSARIALSSVLWVCGGAACPVPGCSPPCLFTCHVSVVFCLSCCPAGLLCYQCSILSAGCKVPGVTSTSAQLVPAILSGSVACYSH